MRGSTRWLFLATALILVTSAAWATIPASERAALIAFYNATGGDGWSDNSGGKTRPLHTDGFALPGTESTWLGVGVIDDHVAVLRLQNKNLTGQLPAALAQLPRLETLDLYYNKLNGAIPPEITSLANLGYLRLSGNQYSGLLPAWLGSLPALHTLVLDSNGFSGPLPATLGNLAQLKELSLWGNQLSGTLPPELGNLTALTHLYLQSNQFSGPLPSSLGGLTALRVLSLDNNDFTGPIPASWGGLSQLNTLNLNGNPLATTIPPELGQLSQLLYLYLVDCQLTGAIPPELGNLTQLQDLWLNYNQLTGPIPAALGALGQVQSFYLSQNQLSGAIPPELGNLAEVRRLSLAINRLSGPLPPALGNLAKLQQLYLFGNQLTGPIPAEWGGLSELQRFEIQNNLLTGPLPATLGTLSKLNVMKFYENPLDGPLPPEWGQLASLSRLEANYCELEGGLPPEWGSLSNLEYLYLYGNRLGGPLPAALGNLTHLRGLLLEGNMFSGEVPASLVNLTQLQPSNIGLDLAYNALKADNPATLAFIDGLTSTFGSTQTIPPAGLQYSCEGGGARLNWQAIPYSYNSGGYRIWRRAAGGGWHYLGETPDKYTSQALIAPLASGVPYTIALDTFTEPHNANSNQVESELGPPLDVLCGDFTPVQARYFPRLGFVPGGWAEGYGFVNAGAADAAVRFTGHGPDGQILGAADPRAWYAGEQGAYQIDGVLGLAAAADGWVLAESNQPGPLGFFLTQRFTAAGLVGLDGAEVFAEGTLDGYFPRVQSSGSFATEIFLGNPGDVPVSVTLTGLDGTGFFPASRATIPAKGLWKFDLAAQFGRHFDGSVQVEADGPVIGNATVRDGDASIASINLAPTAEAAGELYAAHVVLFPGVYYTDLNVVNPNGFPVTVTGAFYLADGSQYGPAKDFSIPAGQVRVIQDTELGLPSDQNTEGWLKLTSPQGPVMGCLTFGRPGDNRYMSTLPLQAFSGPEIYFAQAVNGNVGGVAFFTGLAVLNPNAFPVDVTIRVHASDGTLQGNAVTRTLQPREKYVRLVKFIEGIGTLPDQSSGYLHVTAAGGPVFSFVMFGDAPLNFLSAVPAQVVPAR